VLEFTKITDNILRGRPLMIGKTQNGTSFLNFSEYLIPSTELSIYILNCPELRRVGSIDCTSLRGKLKKYMLMPFLDNFNKTKILLLPLFHHQY